MAYLRCTICGSPYHPYRHDYLEVCPGCIGNLRACVVHDPPDALQVDEDLVRRLLTEHRAEEESYGPL